MRKNFVAVVLQIAHLCVLYQIVSAGKGFKDLASSSIRPVGVIQDWNLEIWNIATLKKKCAEGVKYIEKLGQDIGAANTLDKTLFKRILECDRLYSRYGGTIGSIFSVGSKVSNSPQVRKICSELEQELSKAFLKFDLRRDVYEKLEAFRSSLGQNSLGDVELDKCLDKLIEDRKQNGLHIPDSKVKEIEDVKNKILKRETQFESNLANKTSDLFFTEEELKGLDPELESLRKNTIKDGEHAGKIPVTLDLPLLTKCINPDTRREVQKAEDSKCMSNAGIIKKLLFLRAKLANLVGGGTTYSEYILQPLMAGSPDNVLKFLRKLVPSAQERWEVEKNVMLGMKAEECDKYKLNCDKTKLEMSDYTYFYEKMLNEKSKLDDKYKLDEEKLREYFPLETVLKGIFKIFEMVLGLKISRVENPEKWHESVRAYQVQDYQGGNFGEILGHVYLDLYDRDGKYSYPTVFDMQQGCYTGEGDKLKYVGVVVLNFKNETKEKPKLLYHSQVQTILSLLVHLLGRICGKAKTSLFNGWVGSQTDFHQAPVEMFMNWCYEEESLRRMSRHYETRKPLPDNLIEKLVASRTKDGGVSMLWQLAYGIIDQKLHNLQPVDIDNETFDPLKIYKDTIHDLTGIDVLEGTDPMASWVHLGGGYGAKYYNYLWSGVYGADMFDSTFKKEGILSPEVGKRLRKEFYAPGGTLTGSELFMNFLGRKDASMNMDPFLNMIGASEDV